jgi:hypothetical protein
MRPSFLVLPAVALLFGTPGCAHPGAGANLIVNTAVLAYDVNAATSSNNQREWLTEDGSHPAPEEPELPPETQAALASVPLAVPPHPGRVSEPVRFDLAGAYQELAAVDLEGCKAEGLAPGYGRVVVSFRPDGVPATVVFAPPPDSEMRAYKCVEKAFRAVRVAPFDGSPVMLRRPFFVKG